MVARRSRGEGGVHYDSARKRWIASAQLGFRPNGKRIVRTASGRTKTEAKDRLKELLRDKDDGYAPTKRYSVADCVESWLAHGLSGRSQRTIDNCTTLAGTHIIPELGARQLVDLTADEVDEWLAAKADHLSRATLQRLLSILRRSISRDVRRERVRRNVTLVVEVPSGSTGRPSKSLNLKQATALLTAAEGTPMHAYITLSLLTGARTEELRALTWERLDLEGKPDHDPPLPPTMQVWRSVRKGGDTKTRLSRRTLRLPQRAIETLISHRAEQEDGRDKAGAAWQDHDLVFCSRVGAPLDAANVRRSFRAVVEAAGLDPKEWTPRELRHSFVSLMSAAGVPLEEIARLVGHRSTAVTEAVYRKQLSPVLTEGAEAMDHIFARLETEPNEAPKRDP